MNTPNYRVAINRLAAPKKGIVILSGLGLTVLPPIPDIPGDKKKKITELYCENNNLSELPKLPSTLRILHVFDNPLMRLPRLPDSLVDLGVGNDDGTPQGTLASFEEPFRTYLEAYINSDDILVGLPQLRNSINAYYDNIERKARNLVVAQRTLHSKLPPELLGEVGKALGGEGVMLKNQFNSLRAKKGLPPAAVGVTWGERPSGGGKRKTRKSRKSRKSRKQSHKAHKSHKNRKSRKQRR